MKISIKEMCDTYVASNQKSWSHDRLSTVGASEAFACLRKVAFTKAEVAGDADYEDGWGAKVRGDLVENHLWEPALRSHVPEGVRLLYAGKDQKTFVDGYLSATPDGLMVGVARDCIAHLGVPDVGSDCLVVECKSIDPRVNIKEAKALNIGQTHIQMGLIRHCTSYRPNYAVISYTDASFMDQISEFVVEYDPEVYAAAKARSREIMLCNDPGSLAPEGKIAGGNECKYCPFKSRCAQVSVNRIPNNEVALGGNALAILQELVDKHETLNAQSKLIEAQLGAVKHQIRDFLSEVGTRKASGPGFSVSWSSVKGRKSFDRKAAEKAGLDLSPFDKEGDPSERLSITMN